MGYKRDDAIAYAEKFWNRPCDDGVIWLTDEAIVVEKKRKDLAAPLADGWEALFEAAVQPDGKWAEDAVFRKSAVGTPKVIQHWAGLADCAHYLSKCIQHGGVNVGSLGVATLVSLLQGRGDTKTLAEKVDQAAGQRIVNSGVFKKGDMIGYVNTKPDGDFGAVNAYTHSCMYTGKLDGADVGRITCHSLSRFGGKTDPHFSDKWFLKDGYTAAHN